MNGQPAITASSAIKCFRPPQCIHRRSVGGGSLGARRVQAAVLRCQVTRRPLRTPRSRRVFHVEPPRLLPMTPEGRARAVSLLADLLYQDFVTRSQNGSGGDTA